MNQLVHLSLVSVCENGESENDIELQTAIRDRQMANTTWIELRTITIVVHEMSPRVSALPFFGGRAIEIDAPIVGMLEVAAGARQKPSDIAAEIQNLATAPNRTVKHFIEVSELAYSSRDRTPAERAAQDGYLAFKPKTYQ